MRRRIRAFLALTVSLVTLGVTTPIVYIAFPLSRSGESLVELLARLTPEFATTNAIVAGLWLLVALVPSSIYFVTSRSGTPLRLPGDLVGPILLGFGLPAMFEFVASLVVAFTVLAITTDSNEVPSYAWIPAMRTIELLGVVAVVLAAVLAAIRMGKRGRE